MFQKVARTKTRSYNKYPWLDSMLNPENKFQATGSYDKRRQVEELRIALETSRRVEEAEELNK